MPDPQLIQIKKYPNRRLYDHTRSRHLTHEELYDLVVAGHTVMVTESKTGADITNLVLTQALIERSPEKFASFPPEALHLMIRASEQLLRGAAAGWFAQMMKGMAPMGAPATSAAPTAMGWPPMPGFGWPTAPPPAPAQSARSEAVADLQTRLEDMMREIADLNASRDPGA